MMASETIEMCGSPSALLYSEKRNWFGREWIWIIRGNTNNNIRSPNEVRGNVQLFDAVEFYGVPAKKILKGGSDDRTDQTNL